VVQALSVVHCARAQGEGRSRQAAAEAYDQATAAYLAGEYERAAEWFETAHRMAPASAALIQAARARDKAGNGPRAATLALQLVTSYPDDETAAGVGQALLDKYADELLRVDVECDDCAITLDGTLQDVTSFFLEPESTHVVVAGFDTGDRSAEVSGAAGDTRVLEFHAPLPPEPEPGNAPASPAEIGDRMEFDTADDVNGGWSPIFTYVGAGVTGALLAGSIVATLEVNNAVDDFEDAARAYRACPSDCDALYDEGQRLLDEGEDKQTIRNVLWVATGAAAVGTAIIALTLTDWDGEDEDSDVSLRVAPDPRGRGAYATLEGRF
jgi:tetratricopeptide (TPR) repeat protein